MATLALRVAAVRKPEDTQNIDGPANYMQPVQTVGLFNRATGRWLRVTDQGGADSPSMGAWNQGLTWERFEIRPFNGYAGLYNPATNRWLAVTYQGGANAPLEGPVFDHTAVVCHFVLRLIKTAPWALQNPATGRWVRVTDQGGADSPSMGPWQSEWQWERLRAAASGHLHAAGPDRRALQPRHRPVVARHRPRRCRQPVDGRVESGLGVGALRNSSLQRVRRALQPDDQPPGWPSPTRAAPTRRSRAQCLITLR